MSVARVQFASSGSGGTVTFGTPTTAGNLLVLVASADGAASPVPSGVTLVGSSDVFAQNASAANVNPTADINLFLFSDPNCSGGHTQITATFTGSPTGILLAAWEISGAALALPLAGTPGAAGGPANTLQSAFDSGAGGAVGAGCFWVGAVTGIGSGGRAQAAPSGAWTTEAAIQPGSASQLLPAYQAGPAAGAPEYAGTFTTVTAYWAAIAAAFSPPSSTPPPPAAGDNGGMGVRPGRLFPGGTRRHARFR